MRKPTVCLLWLLCALPASFAAEEPDFAAGVRSTDPLSATEQLKAFQLPEGFKITLFAENPEIAKPMNMAFDSRGRLWVTSSLEYPYAAPDDRKARDSLRILEDTNDDGRADKVTTFADGLNIPIGVYPFNGGASALVWSIPNIWRLDDTNGDGVADKREILLGPIGQPVDTHGMQNGFTRAFDGWVYVCHGFRNESTVTAKDGSEVRLQSGNTYRFRLDGSHIEQYTWGQVNPFGMCLDPLGNHYTADCHSSPIYQLIRGGYYPSFGKPHDGLGFAPVLMQHTHGSTALCGVTYYKDDSNWPQAFRDSLFVGNVMTSSVHTDKVVFNGASPRAIEQEDLLRCKDPWFRPVDIQMGPDGALYVADFYNRIIGHYEVPLTHPGRDRYRGRIWRVTYEGAEPFRKFKSLADASLQEIVERLGDKNLTARLLAMNELTDRYGPDAAAQVHQAWKNSGSPEQRVAALRVLARLGKLEPSDLAGAIASGPNRDERVHALRIAGESRELPKAVDVAAVNALSDSDPFVRRQSSEMLGRHTNARNIPLLLNALKSTPEKDDHQRYVMLRALRNQFTESGAFAAFQESTATDDADAMRIVAGLAISIANADAADFLVDVMAENKATDQSDAERQLQHAARYVSPEKLEILINHVRINFASQISDQARLYESAAVGLRQRGLGESEALRDWAKELALAIFAVPEKSEWSVTSAGKGGNPWVLQSRVRQADNQALTVVSSLPPGGEALTSVLRSRPFIIPSKLKILLCGHDGYPDKPAKGSNFVRLVEAANGAEIARIPAPRNDRVVERTIDLSAYSGRQGYLEIVDGDSGDAYAWLGFGGTDPAVVNLPSSSLREGDSLLMQGVAIVKQWQFEDATVLLKRLATDQSRSTELRRAALEALRGEAAATVAGQVLGQENLAPPLGAEAIKALATHKVTKWSPELQKSAATAIAGLPSRLQREVSLSLAENQGQLLLEFVESGSLGSQWLTDGSIQSALARSNPDNWENKVAALTKNVPSDLERLQKLAAERFEEFKESGHAAASSDRGAQVFSINCAICHQVGGEGSLVGPQLDGVAKRGVERLLEDIINPNQNVDLNFRLSFISLKNGETRAGMFRREEGETLVFADTTGAEFSVAKGDVKSREDSGMSLMPPIHGDALTAEQMFDLVQFLLQQ